MTVSIDILGGTHGNEKLGPILGDKLEAEPVSGVRFRVAHPEAVARGIRHLGPRGQLQSHYPGDHRGDPEDRAAYENMKWLGAHSDSTEALIYDIHDSVVPNLTAFSVGSRALKATMVGAWKLGYGRCYLVDDNFRATVPNAAILENGVTEAEFNAVAEQLHRGLGKLAITDVHTLAVRYDEMVANVRFYTKHEIRTTTDDGTVQSFIPSLEAVPSGAAFTPLNLSDKQRAALRIPDSVDDVLVETWGHQNMSKVNPRLGHTAEGLPRREWFGGYFLPAKPPTSDGEWAIHEDVPSA